MAEGFRSGFVQLLASRGEALRPKAGALLLAFTAGVFIQSAVAQAPSSQAKKAPPANSAQAADTPAPPPAQIWLPPVQNPVHTPVIDWDGKLLTIDAENSSLSDIMLAIRTHTGASIEMPASAKRERIAVHLGPAPIREVLSSLLYGTDFNYVIQSSKDDDSALGKVILIPRDGEQGEDIVADDGQPNQNRKVRLMPGYAAPGKRDFEVAHENAVEDSSSSVAEAPAADSSSPTTDQPAGSPVADSTATPAAATSSTATATDPQPATTESADSGSSTDASPSTLTASGQALSGSSTMTGGGSGGSSSGGGSMGEMQQNLQRLYQQRQQLQAQQNHQAAPQTPAP